MSEIAQLSLTIGIMKPSGGGAVFGPGVPIVWVKRSWVCSSISEISKHGSTAVSVNFHVKAKLRKLRALYSAIGYCVVGIDRVGYLPVIEAIKWSPH